MSRFALAVAGPMPAAEPFWAASVSEFPSFDYSMKDVLRAGEALAGKMLWTEETAPRIRDVFSIASNWRDSHAYPMRKVRNLVRHKIRRLKLSGNTVARLKHMPSIRRKLRDQPWKLNQLQDLAGCRAIIPTIDGVNELIDSLRRNHNHAIHREDPYIREPKRDGYRCHHIVLKFRGDGDEEVFNGRRVEIQVRTRLQHSWATAVETVGLFRQENMKAGLGNPEWLRLFKLMSAQFAAEEGCPEPENVSGGDARLREIVELDKALNAANTLDTLAYAVRYVDTYTFDPQNTAEYFLIRYDSESRVVSVETQYSPRLSVQSYDDAEFDAYKAGPQKRAVLVEADDIDNLYAAYPNYFGDVQIFKLKLKEITQGAAAVEYSLPPQQTVPKKPKEKPDLSWLKAYRRWK
jgi:Region found in RelA / SpoT proteins